MRLQGENQVWWGKGNFSEMGEKSPTRTYAISAISAQHKASVAAASEGTISVRTCLVTAAISTTTLVNIYTERITDMALGLTSAWVFKKTRVPRH